MVLTKNNQKGSTMMETLGVLGIFIMMGAAVLGLISNIWGLFKQNMVVNEARDIQKAISESYKAEGNYKKLLENYEADSDDPIRQLCSEKIVPFQMCSGDKLKHRLGGQVFVSPVEEGEPYSKYMLTFTGLSKKACISLAQINWFTQKQSAIYGMIINDKDPILRNGSDQTLYNFSIGNAMNACDNSTNGTNSIGWIFY